MRTFAPSLSLTGITLMEGTVSSLLTSDTMQRFHSPIAHEELRYRCPNCCARMQNIRAIERGNERPQHVYKCPRCSVIMTERPEE